MWRTIGQIEDTLNEMLRGNFTITSHKILNNNMYEFKIDHGSYSLIHSDITYLYFTPYDSDKTLSKGLWNKGLLTT